MTGHSTAGGVRVERGPVTVIRIENPPANTLTMKVLGEFLAAVNDVSVDPEARAVVLAAGTGPFVSGGDVGELLETVGDEEEIAAHVGLTSTLLQGLLDLPVPLIAAVDGAAVGGGLELLLCCDIIVATASARFGLPEVKLGLIPGAGGTQRLARRTNSTFAAEMLFTGTLVRAQRAMDVGLVTEVVAESAEQRSREIAERIARFSPAAVRAAKSALRANAEELDRGLAVERSLFVGLLNDPATAEGLRAFLTKG